MNNVDSYATMISEFYHNGTSNHLEHNDNPSYWSVLLKRLVSEPKLFEDKFFLDFGCGKGRNVVNAHSIVNWKSADGVDISEKNIDYCKKQYTMLRSNFFKNNGKDLSELESNKYSFVMSTIVLQHLCVYELRLELLKEIFRVMEPGGIFSFQMGFGDYSYTGTSTISKYYANDYDRLGTNGQFDVRVSDPQNVVDDLNTIGFKNTTYTIEKSWEDTGHSHWIYFETNK
jgi:ubiquinone/menaquinone biosynthesis C-methylase UbiE